MPVAVLIYAVGRGWVAGHRSLATEHRLLATGHRLPATDLPNTWEILCRK